MKNVVAIILLTLALAVSASSQERQKVEIYFDQGCRIVDSTYLTNTESLQKLDQNLTRLTQDPYLTLIEISIDSYSSPEGGVTLNDKLSKDRALAMRDYINETHPNFPDSLFVVRSNGIAWDQLKALVQSSETPYKEQVVEIIETIPEETWGKFNPADRWLSVVDSRVKHLMDLKYGRPYNYMLEHLFPLLRQSSVVTLSFRREMEAIAAAPNFEVDKVQPMDLPKPEPQEQKEREITFALKTNLLYDLLLTPNIELEIPIKNKFSVAGEWIFPWWTTSDNGNALQVLSGQVEARYWFGNRTDKPRLTGWFAGLYAGGGLYDLQWHNNGYQGEFYIASGLSGGYAHTINRSETLRLEYSLGVGYLSTNYRYYEGKDDNKFLVWQHDGNYRWFGPTRAKVSLVWLINKKMGGSR